MERRNFIKGVFGGVAAGALIVNASDAEVLEFANPLKIGDPIQTAVTPNRGDLMVRSGEVVFNSEGKIIGVITDVRVSTQYIDTGVSESGFMMAAPGHRRAEFTVLAQGPVDVVAQSWGRK